LSVSVWQAPLIGAVCASVSVCGVPYPSSQAYQLPECDRSPAPLASITPAVAVHGAGEPVSNPGLPSSCFVAQPPDEDDTTQVNDVLPDAPVLSFAVTVTDEVPAVVGLPLIRPLELLIESPAGRLVA